ncbi:MAG: FtsX-like permease family protein [Nibricoccus sp.]
MPAFSVLAVILAAVGVFGVTGYATAQRTREFGIRFAIGASRAHVVRLVLGRVGVLALIGAALGGWAAWELAGLMRSQLYGVDGVDPVVLLSAVALLTIGVLAATLVPVLQALRVNPAEALRAE